MCQTRRPVMVCIKYHTHEIESIELFNISAVNNKFRISDILTRSCSHPEKVYYIHLTLQLWFISQLKIIDWSFIGISLKLQVISALYTHTSKTWTFWKIIYISKESKGAVTELCETLVLVFIYCEWKPSYRTYRSLYPK